jgi:uncharacterized membrane protein YdjX (TVP38/TMEM64 family)
LPVIDDVGTFITSIAFTVAMTAVMFYLLHWVIRSAVQSALRRHQFWLEARDRDARRGPTGAIGNDPAN